MKVFSVQEGGSTLYNFGVSRECMFAAEETHNPSSENKEIATGQEAPSFACDNARYVEIGAEKDINYIAHFHREQAENASQGHIVTNQQRYVVPFSCQKHIRIPDKKVLDSIPGECWPFFEDLIVFIEEGALETEKYSLQDIGSILLLAEAFRVDALHFFLEEYLIQFFQTDMPYECLIQGLELSLRISFSKLGEICMSRWLEAMSCDLEHIENHEILRQYGHFITKIDPAFLSRLSLSSRHAFLRHCPNIQYTIRFPSYEKEYVVPRHALESSGWFQKITSGNWSEQDLDNCSLVIQLPDFSCDDIQPHLKVESLSLFMKLLCHEIQLESNEDSEVYFDLIVLSEYFQVGRIKDECDNLLVESITEISIEQIPDLLEFSTTHALPRFGESLIDALCASSDRSSLHHNVEKWVQNGGLLQKYGHFLRYAPSKLVNAFSDRALALFFDACPNLEQVHFLSSQASLEGVRFGSKLRILSLDGCKNISDAALLQAIKPCVSSIQEIDISRTNLSLQGVRFGQQVRVFKAQFAKHLHDETLAHALELSSESLQEVDVTGTLLSFHLLRLGPSLRILKIVGCKYIENGAFFQAVRTAMPYVEYIDLTGTNLSLEHITFGEALKTVKIVGCREVTDAHFFNAIAQATHLKKVDITWTSLTLSGGVFPSNLEELYCANCHEITRYNLTKALSLCGNVFVSYDN